MSWYVAVLKKYAVFSGRARRKEYWYFFLVNFIIAVVLGVLTALVGGVGQNSNSGSGSPVSLGLSCISSLYSLAVLLPGLGVGKKAARYRERWRVDFHCLNPARWRHLAAGSYGYG
jgi:uncharacterized membrane protein YhaH (DUF805 family)